MSVNSKLAYEKSLVERSTKPVHTCDFCSRKFVTKQGVQRHLIKSHDKSSMPFACPECEKKFTFKRELAEHMLNTTHPKDFKNRDFACGFCRQKFFTDDHREDHWQTHYDNPKPHTYAWKYSIYECDECRKKFPSKEYCMAHLRKHETNYKKYGCSDCSKRFSVKQNLEWHEKYHMEESKKPFPCELCEIRFESQKLLDKHLESEFHKSNINNSDTGKKEQEEESISESEKASTSSNLVVKTEVLDSEMGDVQVKFERQVGEEELSILGLPYHEEG